MVKKRLDILLAEQGLAESREKAQRLIRAGMVKVNDQPATKPGQQVDDTLPITVEGGARYVSRGGEKLQGAMDHWPHLHPEGQICIDIGSSTGGFTDCMLQHGAVKVYAVDVGKGELHWNLRNDDRVAVMEQTNARYIEPHQFDPRPTFCSIDVSFISLELILPAAQRIVQPGSDILSLIKPQFEAGAKFLRKGVVVDPQVRERVCEDIRLFGEGLGLRWHGIIPSPIHGPKGNVEFIAHWTT